MRASRWRLCRPPVLAVRQQDVDEALGRLTPAQAATLGGLHRAPRSVAASVAQLLPFGSRTDLRQSGLMVTTGPGRPDGGQGPVGLTRLARSAMSVLAACAVADPAGVENWTRQAELAAGLHERRDS